MSYSHRATKCLVGFFIVIIGSLNEDTDVASIQFIHSFISILTMSSSSTSNIHHATYPLPQPLALLLEAAASGSKAANKESKETALTQILSNALQAVDRLYFSETSTNRTSPWFVHRTCLRICIVSSNNAITITDLGTGMTRGDLINTLGIGRVSRKAAQYVVKHKMMGNQDEDESGVDESDVDVDESSPATQDSETEDVAVTKEEEDGETVDTDDENDDDDTSENDDDDDDDDSLLPCTEADIGGFYAALCALGVGVTIGTKVSFASIRNTNVLSLRSR